MYRGFFTKEDIDARWKKVEQIRFSEKPSMLKLVFHKIVGAFRAPSLPPMGEELDKREGEAMRNVVAKVSRGHHCK